MFFFKKLSIGALGGIQSIANPDLFMLKLGGVLKFYFVDRDNVYMYLQGTPLISLNKDQFKNGFSGRIGLGFPAYRNKRFNATVNIFAEHIDLNMRGAKSILEGGFDTPLDLTLSTWGISLGAQF